MRYALLKSEVNDKGVIFLALTEIHQKASGVGFSWIDITEVKIDDTTSGSQGNLLLFDDKEQLEEDLELWEITADNLAIIGVQVA